MASIVLLDSSASTAAPLSTALISAGHSVREARLPADIAGSAVVGGAILVVREHVGAPLDPGEIRRLTAALRAAGLVALAPPVRWVTWIAVADRVLPDGATAQLVVDAVRHLDEPAQQAPVAVKRRPTAVVATAGDDTAPQVGIPGYHSLRLLGRGGMSVVYQARHETSRETRVLKLLPISDHDGGVLVQRLINEAALLSQLQHPGIVRIHEQGFTEWHAYIAMEYVPGGELTALLGAPMPPALAVEILLQLAEALGAIHRAGMVHRDLKPANILRRDDGSFVLADFGIARKRGVDLSRSGPGQLVGTAAYLAPETIGSGIVDHRSDLYALGVLFHEMLTGRKPYEADSALEVMNRHLDAPIPPLPADLGWAQALLDGLMAKRPADRFDTADTLITAVLNAVTEQQQLSPDSGPRAAASPHRSHADAG